MNNHTHALLKRDEGFGTIGSIESIYDMFEKEALGFFPELDIKRNANGNYTNSQACHMFEGFRLALERISRDYVAATQSTEGVLNEKFDQPA